MRSFVSVANDVAGSLPKGWEVRIGIERDSGWVELLDRWGEKVEFPSNHETLEDEVYDALRHARHLEGD